MSRGFYHTLFRCTQLLLRTFYPLVLHKKAQHLSLEVGPRVDLTALGFWELDDIVVSASVWTAIVALSGHYKLAEDTTVVTSCLRKQTTQLESQRMQNSFVTV